jgi:hypothetical protein
MNVDELLSIEYVSESFSVLNCRWSLVSAVDQVIFGNLRPFFQ